jgi:nicotinamide-nucleotide amidase
MAAIIAIGDELVGAEKTDLNSDWLVKTLAGRAIVCRERRIVPDDRSMIAEAIRELTPQCDILITTGGLGPTPDDLTRYGLGDVVSPGRDLISDEAANRRLERWFAKRVGSMPESNRLQALRPEPCSWLANPRGTALGLAARIGECRVYCLPGPPHEMQGMFCDEVLPQLAAHGGRVLRAELVHAFGIAEADAAERLGEILARDADPQVGITVSGSIVSARLRATGPPEEADRLIETASSAIEERWQPWAYGRGETTLAEAMGAELLRAGRTLATAESCTGGLLGKFIVDVAGSSAYYRGGWVTYTDALKTACLGVPAELIADHGAVSEPVARVMAEGARTAAGANEALAITGIAGPEGGSDLKPVGTVFIAQASEGGPTTVRRFRFPGERQTVRERAARTALQMVRLSLLDARNAPLLWEVAT